MGQHYDVIVIGAGPGGYVAAIRSAQLGFKTLCVDRFKGPNGGASLGGTCLNVGCIPSKALLQSSENVHLLQHEFADHGITIKSATFDAPRMIARKDAIVKKLTFGIGFLFKKNKVDSIFGSARLIGQENGKWLVHVLEGTTTHPLTADHIIIATGSIPRSLPGIRVDNISILDNEGALNMSAVPKRLGVIGAGVIGLEMGSIWKRLSSEVTLLEAMPAFLPQADQQIAQEAFKFFTQNSGLNIELGVKIKEVETGTHLKIIYEVKGDTKTLLVDKLIVSVGRAPNTEGLGTLEVGLKLDDRGLIVVDDQCKTNLPNIWAIGDVVRGPMLAHKASEEGVAVAERIAGQKPKIDLGMIPFVIYTSPELAWVGKTEEQLKTEGVEYKKGSSSFISNGRALGMGQAKGFIKMLSCAKTDRILGVHMFGPLVSELIAEVVVAMEFQASAEDLARIVHAHPTLSEVTHEAALAVDHRALHG